MMKVGRVCACAFAVSVLGLKQPGPLHVRQQCMLFSDDGRSSLKFTLQQVSPHNSHALAQAGKASFFFDSTHQVYHSLLLLI